MELEEVEDTGGRVWVTWYDRDIGSAVGSDTGGVHNRLRRRGLSLFQRTFLVHLGVWCLGPLG